MYQGMEGRVSWKKSLEGEVVEGMGMGVKGVEGVDSGVVILRTGEVVDVKSAGRR
jgi:hypothetical protein